MNVRQGPNLKQHKTYSSLVAQKNALLEGVLDLATAEGAWELDKDNRGRPLLLLRLTDQLNGQTTAAFAPEELQNDAHLSSRLRGLKGALLHVGHWRGQLQQLFADVRRWCQGLPGGAYVQEEPMVVREERSGEYEVTRLIVSSKGQTMRVEPVALWVVGADGRVDLKGIGGPFTLLYFQQDGGWAYVQNGPPAVTMPLTEGLFLQLAEACLDG